MLVRGFSKALFSTWFSVPEIRAVFDAGEGINFLLGGRLARANTVFLTHGHSDHFTGLLNLLIARTRLASDEGELPPVDIYYPHADGNLGLYIDYVQRHLRANEFQEVARFHGVEPGQDYPLSSPNRHFVRVFPVKHGPLPAVGYCVFETRDKVRAEYAARSPREIGQLILEKGRSAILEPQDAPLVCYSGDSAGAVDAPCRRPRLLFHEATFLTEADRNDSNHAILAEALDSARKMAPSELLLFHFSSRYSADDIVAALDAEMQARPLEDCKVLYALPGRQFTSEGDGEA